MKCMKIDGCVDGWNRMMDGIGDGWDRMKWMGYRMG